jgi:V/A-type H+-transporting ATPase subunit E
MAYQELLQSMELGADEKVKNILEHARLEGEAILDEARKNAETIKKKLVTKARDEVEAKRNHARYILHEELKADMAREKQALFTTSFDRAAELVKSCRNDPRYSESFSRLLKEAVEGIPGNQVVVHIDPQDSALMNRFSSQYGSRLIIKPDLTSSGGVMASTPGGEITIRNTIESRLENARDALKQEVYSLLFG